MVLFLNWLRFRELTNRCSSLFYNSWHNKTWQKMTETAFRKCSTNRCFVKLNKIHNKVSMLESHLNIFTGLQHVTLLRKRPGHKCFPVITFRFFVTFELEIVKESHFRTWYIINLTSNISILNFAVCWRYFWCVYTHRINTCFEISNILKSFVIFAKWNYQSIMNFSIPMNFDNFLTHFRILLEQVRVYTYGTFNPKRDKIRVLVFDF